MVIWMTAAIDKKCNSSDIYSAAKNNDLEDVKCHFENGADMNKKHPYSAYVPLHFAAYYGHLNVVKYLIEETHADINIKDDSGRTPMHLAALNGQLYIVKYLIEKEADLNSIDDFQQTPLIYAASYGALNIVKYLIEDVSENITNIDESEILHSAARGDNLDVVQYLIKKGANVNKKNYIGETPLFIATRYGHINVVKYLIEEANADLNIKNEYGETSLKKARSQVMKDYLKSKGAQ